jgi:hypothetical protein
MLSLITGTGSASNPLTQALAVQTALQQTSSTSALLAYTSSAQDTVTLSKAAQALSKYQQGQTILQIATQLGVDVETVSSYLGLAEQQETAYPQNSGGSLSATAQAEAYLRLANMQAVLGEVTSQDSTATLLQTIQGSNLPLTAESQGSSTVQDYIQQGFSTRQAYQISSNQALMDSLSSQTKTINAYF